MATTKSCSTQRTVIKGGKWDLDVDENNRLFLYLNGDLCKDAQTGLARPAVTSVNATKNGQRIEVC